MTYAAIKAVLLKNLSSTAKLVLLVLAHHADKHSRSCYLLVETLQKECSLSDRCVQNTLSELVRQGLITREFRKNKSSVFTLQVEQVPEAGSPPTPEAGSPITNTIFLTGTNVNTKPCDTQNPDPKPQHQKPFVVGVKSNPPTPFNKNFTKENPMSESDVILNKLAAKQPLNLVTLWKKRMATLYPDFYKPLVQKEIGQLNQIKKQLGDSAFAVADYVLMNWLVFSVKVRSTKGADMPSTPVVGVLLKYWDVALLVLQDSTKKPASGPYVPLPVPSAHVVAAVTQVPAAGIAFNKMTAEQKKQATLEMEDFLLSMAQKKKGGSGL